MKRRSFLQFLGLAPAAAAVPAAASAMEKVAQTAAKLEPKVEAVPVYETMHGAADCCCSVTCGTMMSEYMIVRL